MEQQKVKSINHIIIFFISYSFYVVHFLVQYLLYKYSKQAIFITCIFSLLLPLITYLICKIINNHKTNNIKNNFLFSIFSALYLIITTIIVVLYIISLTTIYYYQQTSIIILLIFLILPIIYSIIKGNNIIFSLSIFLLIAFTFFKYIYISNPTNLDLYPFYNILQINASNIIPISLISLPTLLEPIILLNNKNQIIDKVNIKFAVIFSFIISSISILTILRETAEYGNLLSNIRFPYLESIKNIVTGSFLENIDNYYLISATVAIYVRITYTLTTIKESFNLSKTITIGVLIIMCLIIYFLFSNLTLYETIIKEALIITSISLLILAILLPFTKKRRSQNV